MRVLYGHVVARMFVLRGVVCILYGTVRWCSVRRRGNIIIMRACACCVYVREWKLGGWG